jgi:sugar/nucleoside kinase (ribokinase family)
MENDIVNNPTKMIDVAVAGQLCLDIIPSIPESGVKKFGELFKPGKLTNVGAAKLSTGGPVSNAGIALEKLGVSTVFIARIGDDEFGKMVLKLLQDFGDTSNIYVSNNDRTSYTIAICPPGIDRTYLYDPGANNNFSSEDLNPNILSNCKIFHFGYPPSVGKSYKNEGEDLLKIFQMTKSFGATTSLDMTLPDPNSPSGQAPWKKILKKVLPFVDIFMPSIEEIFYMLRAEEYLKIKESAGDKEAVEFIKSKYYSQLAQEALEMGTKIVGLKTGFRGLFVRTKDLISAEFGKVYPKNLENWSNREMWCPAYQISKIKSATGSGDSAIAGFLAAFLNGCSIEKSAKYANCLGYQNLHELDAVSGIKSWSETTELIEKENLDIIDILQLETKDWKWNEKDKLWIGQNDKFFSD